jgi:hypothetical protein
LVARWVGDSAGLTAVMTAVRSVDWLVEMKAGNLVARWVYLKAAELAVK